MSSNNLSLGEQQLKERRVAMEAYIDALPQNKTLPLKGESAEYSALIKTLAKLNAFIQFLANLSPKKYFQWMQKAFANAVPDHTLNASEGSAPLVEYQHTSDEIDSAFVPTAGDEKGKKIRLR